jgi:hypothetical protein
MCSSKKKLTAYKLAISPNFTDPTAFKDNNPLCASDCRQPVSNDQYRGLPCAKNLVNGIIYLESAKLAATHPKKSMSHTLRSEVASKELVASSKASITGFFNNARAIARRCRCPPLKLSRPTA